MMWTMLADGTFVSERDDQDRRGVLYTGAAVTNTQARSGYVPFEYYGFLSATDELPSPTRSNGLVDWGSLERAMHGVERKLAEWHEIEAQD